MNPISNLSFNLDASIIANNLRTNNRVNPFFSSETIEAIANNLAYQELPRDALPPLISRINPINCCYVDDRTRAIQNLMDALIHLGSSSR